MLKRVGAARTVIVLLNWNGAVDTDRCLASLSALTDDVSVILVDNASSDREIEKIASSYPEVTFRQNAKNSGFGCGNNIGINWALSQNGWEFLFILNNDTVIKNGSIVELECFMDKMKDAVAASPLIVYGDDEEKVWYGGGSFEWRKGGARSWLMNEPLPKKLETTKVGFITGCAMFIRRNCMKTLGGFDENFFMYVEDWDMSLRLAALGNIYLNPAVVVVHHAHGSLRTDKTINFLTAASAANPKLLFVVSETIKNTRYLASKHKPRFGDAAQFWMYFYSRWLYRAIKYALSGRADVSRGILKQLF